jgi:2,5-furandicarboxylate decarboxylase 1
VSYHEHVFTKVRVPGEEDVDLPSWIEPGARVDFSAVAGR